MKPVLKGVLLLCLLPPAWAAVAAGEGQGAALEKRVLVLERKVRAISDLVLRMERLQREVQQLRGELEEQNHALETMKQRQRALYLDLDKRLGGLASPAAGQETPPTGQETGPATPVAPPLSGKSRSGQAPGKQPPQPVATRPVPAMAASPREEKAYQQAFELLGQRRYKEAKRRFQAFLKNYPDGFYADNAQYWLAEASYVTRDFDTALAEFRKLLARYPDSPKVPGAMLKIGYIQYEKQQRGQARQTLETLIDRYPASSAARLATSFIRKKGL